MLYVSKLDGGEVRVPMISPEAVLRLAAVVLAAHEPADDGLCRFCHVSYCEPYHDARELLGLAQVGMNVAIVHSGRRPETLGDLGRPRPGDVRHYGPHGTLRGQET